MIADPLKSLFSYHKFKSFHFCLEPINHNALGIIRVDVWMPYFADGEHFLKS